MSKPEAETPFVICPWSDDCRLDCSCSDIHRAGLQCHGACFYNPNRYDDSKERYCVPVYFAVVYDERPA